MTDNLLATLENTLRQTRASRSRLASRLSEVELEAASLKAEMAEMDALAAQTEATMYRFMTAVLGGSPVSQNRPAPQFAPPSATLSGYYAPPSAPQQEYAPPATYSQPVAFAPSVSAPPPPVAAPEPVAAIPVAAPVLPEDPPAPAAFEDYANLTIPQATARLLAKAGRPLHVNEIYEQLRSGGFVFSGHNPTISIAVSLNRNQRFSKVSPGTFGLAR